MRKFVLAFFLFTLMFGGGSVTAYAVNCTKDAPIDRAADWFAVLGKRGAEKDRVLAQRRTNRVVACVNREAEKMAKKARKAGNGMKRKLGF